MWLVGSAWAQGWLEKQANQRLDGRNVEIGALDGDWGWPREWLEKQASQRLDGRNVEIGALDVDWGWPLVVRLEDVKVANPDWASHEHMLELEALELEVDTRALLSGNIQLQRLDLQSPVVHLARGEDGAVNWEGVIDQEPGQEPGIRPDVVNVEEGRLTYRDALLEADIDADFETRGDEGEERELVAQAQGSLQGQELDLEVRGDAPAQALASDPLDYEARLEGQLGGSPLSGSVSVVMEDRPHIETQLDIERLDLDRWDIAGMEDADDEGQDVREEDEATEEENGVSDWQRRWAERLSVLREFSGEADLSIDRLDYGDDTLRDVALEVRIAEGRLDVERLHAAHGESGLTAQGWLEPTAEALEGAVDAELSQVGLQELLAPLGLDAEGVLNGRLHARFTQGRLVFEDTSLDYRAPAHSLALHVNADTVRPDDMSVPGVRLQGNGTYNARDFAYDLVVGLLLNLNDPDKPYPVEGRIIAGETSLTVDGTVEQPLALSALQGTFHLTGPNPSRLNLLTGLNLPDLPPYELEGELDYRESLVHLRDAQGRFGDSDVRGDVRLRLGERNMLWATLHSTQMVLGDLAPLTGAKPTPGDEAEGWRGSVDTQPARLFPDNEWNVQGLRSMDAEVVYSAEDVDARYAPLNHVALELTLDRGLLTLKPLQIGVGGGEVNSRLTLDAREEPLSGDLALSIRQVNLSPILREAELGDIAEDSAGTIGGEAQFSFQGNSMASVMASLDGALELAMSGGELDMLLVEAAGLDVGEALLGALAEADQVLMRCAYAQLESEDGTATLEEFFIDTEDSNFTGAGTADLGNERLELIFEAHPKDPSLLASDSPVRVEGALTDLKVNVVSRELLARGALSALGALVAPPLAIVPWIELGTGENVGPGCRQVLGKFAAGDDGG
ncbi:AsmA family protein [Halomonas sp. TRM85114]|uniref:AsmA family protein n=1 Tax=Halomonas jincaotanensis TaxID=2810616 RepID=UPI001BD3D99F|nr:AsmA family protein [Halomonas jincaotanensis]MBS9403173.1 AsmA family protein [Halomonas jincaotanensis]